VLDLSYVLPLRSPVPDLELREYLEELAEAVADIVVVDASAPEVRAVHERWWGKRVTHVVPDPARRCSNGKVWGVLTGLDHAGYDAVIIADDDVRWDRPGLARVNDLLASAELVAPANYFSPLPWHARYDTGRTLIQRALGGDWPGTLAVRRESLAAFGGGYDGNVLFENLELVRTVEAGGGRVVWAMDLFVARRPPTARHFLGQRVRQAYDELARPLHLLASLSVLPILSTTLARGRIGALLALVTSAVLTAELGRRRNGGTRVYPASSVPMAAVWMVERSVTSWLALWCRQRGGVRYAGNRISRAASSRAQLRSRARTSPVLREDPAYAR
jgi:hypothetical protein